MRSLNITVGVQDFIENWKNEDYYIDKGVIYCGKCVIDIA